MTADKTTATRSGQPLWALGGLLLCWMGLRAALIELPAAPMPAALEDPRKAIGLAQAAPEVRRASLPGAAVQRVDWQPVLPRPIDPVRPLPMALRPTALPLASTLPVRGPDSFTTARGAAGHNLLWIAAMGAVPLLPEVTAALARARSERSPAAPLGQNPPVRWSGDAWLAWRPGSSGLVAPGATTPVYGGSQAGALLSYDMAPGSLRRLSAYVRVVSALDTAREGDIAAGVAVRPLAGVPVTAHGEARLSRRGSMLALRPAAFVSGGVERAPMAAGITARGYAQAGYVGGPDATAFADGSLIAEKPLGRDRDALMTAGAGVWGGAQRGAARLDIGPTASLRFQLGEGTARVSADYRLRVAGNAAPAAGAALTLSAGF